MNSKRLPEKDPGETIVLCWTASLPEDPQALIVGTPEIAIVVDQSLRRGQDPNVEEMVIGIPEVVDNIHILQALTLGVDGVDYRIRCAVDMNSVPPTRLVMSSIVPVRRQ